MAPFTFSNVLHSYSKNESGTFLWTKVYILSLSKYTYLQSNFMFS